MCGRPQTTGSIAELWEMSTMVVKGFPKPEYTYAYFIKSLRFVNLYINIESSLNAARQDIPTKHTLRDKNKLMLPRSR